MIKSKHSTGLFIKSSYMNQVNEFYCLKVLITLEQVVEKKNNRNEQNFDQWGRWCG